MTATRTSSCFTMVFAFCPFSSSASDHGVLGRERAEGGQGAMYSAQKRLLAIGREVGGRI
jgi:hypothetical protein